MSIRYIEETKQFLLQTENTAYVMGPDGFGILKHIYYGLKTGCDDLSYMFRNYDRGFSGNPYYKKEDRSYSLDSMQQEYTSFGVGDYRIPSVNVLSSDGSCCGQFHYSGYEMFKGKYDIPGLPSVYDSGDTVDTLIITLEDSVTSIKVKLYYGVFEERDVITRTARIINESSGTVYLNKASSVCLELPFGDWDMMHFYGRHCMERQPERVHLFHGIQALSSSRGMSGHQHNPFVIICDRKADEESGTCYGLMLVYSGNHKTEIELDQFESVRVLSGINDEGFCWELSKGESFCTPEVIMSCTSGLTGLTHNFHNVIRNNIIRGKFKYSHRPVLVNNWEATYFAINEEKAVAIAERARDLGIEMFVLDDGWFKNRNDDNSGLGDWAVDTDKFPGGLERLISRVNDMGLSFGLWIEPEMISEKSNLYLEHPDWVLSAPGRKPMMGRNQMVLDLSREDVHDYLYNVISGLLEKYNIEYIKWDFNRPVSDVYSSFWPSSRQGEVMHRYYLSLYKLYDRLTEKFPNVLFEGCAGGGGRFDAGMLYYSPQIWCSDNTDPISRLKIHYGTSFGYPSFCIGAHVSASPNHQTGRRTSLKTRATVAMSGVFGYELNLASLSEDECEEIRNQISRYKELEDLISGGDYYRLTDINESACFCVWQYVSSDKSRSLLSAVVTDPLANGPDIHVYPKGLAEDAAYSVGGEFECSGRSLMQTGYTLSRLTGDYASVQIDIIMK